MVNNHPVQSLFDLSDVRRFAKDKKFALVTKRARHRLQDLEWSSRHVVELFDLLNEGHFQCIERGMQTDEGPLDCDSYCIRVIELDRLEEYDCNDPESRLLREATSRETATPFYIKFSFDTHLDPEIAIVSIHISGAP